MKPIFNIAANGDDITALIKDRLVELTVTDRAGMQSDSLVLVLDDRDHLFELPEAGALLAIALGWEGASLTPVGQFVVDAVDVKFAPKQLVIRAKAADMLAGLKHQKTRVWEDATIGDIVSTIAAEHSLKAAVSESFKTRLIRHLSQIDESDLNLLTRLATQTGAVAKPASGHLLFVTKGEGKTATGDQLDPIVIDGADILPGSHISLPSRGQFSSVKSCWHNLKTGKREEVTVGDGEPCFAITQSYPDADQAQTAAQAKFAECGRSGGSGSIKLLGRPEAVAESPVELMNVRAGVDVGWIASTVTHSVRSGFSTTIELEKPNQKTGD